MSDYHKYLLTAEWEEKRLQRIAMGGGRCAACLSKHILQVHHLTYERVYREEMSDLVPLCKTCHESIEIKIADGQISRKGNTLFLLSETIRLLLSGPKVSKAKRKTLPFKKQPNLLIGGIDVSKSRTGKDIQRDLTKFPEFVTIVEFGNRNRVAEWVTHKFGKRKAGRISNAAHIIFDRYKRSKQLLSER